MPGIMLGFGEKQDPEGREWLRTAYLTAQGGVS